MEKVRKAFMYSRSRFEAILSAVNFNYISPLKKYGRFFRSVFANCVEIRSHGESFSSAESVGKSKTVHDQ